MLLSVWASSAVWASKYLQFHHHWVQVAVGADALDDVDFGDDHSLPRDVHSEGILAMAAVCSMDFAREEEEA